MKRLQKEEQLAAQRLEKIEEMRNEHIKKREIEYKAKRDALIRFAQQKDANETEACREYLKVLESKIARTEEKHRLNLTEKVERIQEHNMDVLEKNQLTHDRRFQEWMSEQETFFRHLQKIDQQLAKKNKKEKDAKGNHQEKLEHKMQTLNMRKADEEH